MTKFEKEMLQIYLDWYAGLITDGERRELYIATIKKFGDVL